MARLGAQATHFRPHNDVKLATLKESPLLQREGFTENQLEKEGKPVPTTEGT